MCVFIKNNKIAVIFRQNNAKQKDFGTLKKKI